MERLFFVLMVLNFIGGGNSIGRVTAFQAVGCGFEPRLPLADLADVAQSVEHILGKDEVSGSIPLMGSSSANRSVSIADG